MAAPPECILELRVKPRAKRAGLVGRHGKGFKLAVRAAPERGRANAELVSLLADLLGIDARAIDIAQGATSQDKQVRIQGLTRAEVERRLDAALDPS
jgi:hypothetical protein